MSARDVLLLGNPALYQVCTPVAESQFAHMDTLIEDLHDTLMAFRDRYGAGRAIAAPQIGIPQRLIYMQIDRPLALFNPRLDRLSDEMIEVWDDCMSFPDLLVKVWRHRSCRITFRDADWQEQTLELEGDLSELLQHETDHLDGILAVSRAVDAHSLCLRSQAYHFTNT